MQYCLWDNGQFAQQDVLPALPTSPLPLQRAVAIEAAPLPVPHTHTHTRLQSFLPKTHQCYEMNGFGTPRTEIASRQESGLLVLSVTDL